MFPIAPLPDLLHFLDVCFAVEVLRAFYFLRHAADRDDVGGHEGIAGDGEDLGEVKDVHGDVEDCITLHITAKRSNALLLKESLKGDSDSQKKQPSMLKK